MDLKKKINVEKTKPQTAKMLGQVAVQEMTQVSTGPSGLLGADTDRGRPRFSRRKVLSGVLAISPVDREPGRPTAGHLGITGA